MMIKWKGNNCIHAVVRSSVRIYLTIKTDGQKATSNKIIGIKNTLLNTKLNWGGAEVGSGVKSKILK